LQQGTKKAIFDARKLKNGQKMGIFCKKSRKYAQNRLSKVALCAILNQVHKKEFLQ